MFTQASDDGKEFESPFEIGAMLSSDGTTVSTFEDLSQPSLGSVDYGGKRFIRFGVRASNTSGSGLNPGYVTLRIEGRDY